MALCFYYVQFSFFQSCWRRIGFLALAGWLNANAAPAHRAAQKGAGSAGKSPQPPPLCGISVQRRRAAASTPGAAFRF